MTESIKIIQQALEGLPGGPYENLESRGFDRKLCFSFSFETRLSPLMAPQI
jgi:NADH:ubiquinone oxidoreductase subunit D